MGIYRTHGSYGAYETYKSNWSHKSHESHSDTHRILILGPAAVCHQLQNVLPALRGRSDHGLFDFICDRIFPIFWPRSLHIATV
jgi:hypothetical protein